MLETVDFNLAAPDPASTVVRGCVRMQFLTERLVRLEWAEDGVFEDRQTLAVINRRVSPVSLRESAAPDGWTVWDSGAVRVALKPDGCKLNAGNCRVSFELDGKEVVWTPGTVDDGNLGGTIRTLDLCYGKMKVVCDVKSRPQWEEAARLDLGNGFISRSGWSLIDDSRNVVVDKIEGRKWVAPRSAGERQDWYLLAYGHDYTAALKDAAGVFGSQPLPPRFALGYWWSRYWAYSDVEVEELVTSFRRMAVPLDVMVIDMDWHLEGWTGYTWDRRYFPDPAGHMRWLHRHGCKVSLNLHPADGVGKHEEQFPAMAQAMGLDAEKADRVPFNIVDPKYMKHYFELLHHPQEKDGVDFWWMDWQQGESSAMPGLDTLPWINHLHWEDMQRRGDNSRPLIFSRFGGYGAGRYNVGFSGDTYSVWESLAFQPYFTATASNVLYGYWSHDLGGHMPGEIEPELYLRWLQFGMYSPVMRTHTTKNDKAERRFWAYSDPFGTLMMQTVRDRYALVPYIYSEDRKAYDSGVSLVRPMYYAYPKLEEAYQASDQYFFGDAMLVAPSDPESGLAERKIWLPEGEWFDTARGKMETGGRWISRQYLLGEIPVFVRPGTVIPRQQVPENLDAGCYRKLMMSVYPGASGSYELYEDDGVSQDYIADKFATIRMAQQDHGGVKRLTVKSTGFFNGFEAERELTCELFGYAPPKRVCVRGAELPQVFRLEDAEAPAWAYDGKRACVVIKAGPVDIVRGFEAEVELNTHAQPLADGLAGLLSRLEILNYYNTVMTSYLVLYPNERLGIQLAQAGQRIARRPASFASELEMLRRSLPELRAMFDALGTPPFKEFRNMERSRRYQKVLRILDSMEEQPE